MPDEEPSPAFAPRSLPPLDPYIPHFRRLEHLHRPSAICSGCETDDFCKQLKSDIDTKEIEGASYDPDSQAQLLYVSGRLGSPRVTSIRGSLYRLADDALGHFSRDKSYRSPQSLLWAVHAA